MRSAVSLAVVLLIGAACAPGAPASPASAAVVFETRAGDVRVRVELAETESAREKGLMGRTELAADAGMLFVWPEDATSPFWMKDTLIPLSIAFIGPDGRVLALLDMDPCRADPCPVYDPQTAYRMALEVTRGAFTRWGVRVGDHARLVR